MFTGFAIDLLMTISLHNTVFHVFLCLSPDSVVLDSPALEVSLSATGTAQIAHAAVSSILSAGCLSFLALDQMIRPLAPMPQLAFVQNACHKPDSPLSESHHDSFTCMKQPFTHAFLRVAVCEPKSGFRFLNRLFPAYQYVCSRPFFCFALFCFALSFQHNPFIIQ